MARFFLSKIILPLLISLLIFFPYLQAAQEVPSERLVERRIPTPAMVEEKPAEEWDVSVFYERSNVVQGNSYGHWDELTPRISYSRNNILGYVSVSELERFQERDYTANAGTYFTLNKYFIHEEAGFGWDVDFIYKFQNILEVGHKLYKNLFWQMGYNYRAYIVNDTHLMYPGLIYYFGNNYVGLDYGLSVINSRGLAQYGVLKSDFALTKFLHWQLGTAIGQRLYDIFGYDTRKEYGYIIFTGANFNINKDISFKVGYSYGMENPKFIKRSLNLSLAAKF